MIFGILGLIIFSIIFILILKYNRYSSWLGVSFIIVLLNLIYIFAELAFTYNFKIFFILIALILIPFLVMFIFGLYILVGFLLYASYRMFKNEGFSFRNSLALIIAVAIIVYSVISLVSGNINNDLFKLIWQYISVLAALGMFLVVLFFLNTLLVNLIKPNKRPDYLIILGSGLIKGKVPPLLAARINKGLAYLKKCNLTDVPIIFSGGQGSDEPTSEAQAMSEYAIKQGFDPKLVMIENQSTNTYENLKYSKQIIEEISDNYFCLFFTNNFHVFRAGVYAQQLNFDAIGIGSRTAPYYLPNALAREFIALVIIKKKSYVIILVLVTLLFLFSYIIAIIS